MSREENLINPTLQPFMFFYRHLFRTEIVSPHLGLNKLALPQMYWNRTCVHPAICNHQRINQTRGLSGSPYFWQKIVIKTASTKYGLCSLKLPRVKEFIYRLLFSSVVAELLPFPTFCFFCYFVMFLFCVLYFYF